MKFIAIVWATFLARTRPVSTSANPACMNMTRKPATSVHMMFMLVWVSAICLATSLTDGSGMGLLLLALQGFLDERWSDQRRDEHDEHDRGKDRVVDHGVAVERHPAAGIGDDQADLAARDHADADREAVDRGIADAEPAQLLAHDRRDALQRREAEDGGVCERAQIEAESHADEEQGDEHGRQRARFVGERARAVRAEVPEVDLVENQPGRECFVVWCV